MPLVSQAGEFNDGEATSSAPRRIQLSRRAGWRKPEGAIVVARPSRWGNPFPVKRWELDLSLALFAEAVHGMWRPSLLAAESDESFAEAYEANSAWRRRIGGHPAEIAPLELGGHDLACWCPLDQPCHADLLLAVANRGMKGGLTFASRVPDDVLDVLGAGRIGAPADR